MLQLHPGGLLSSKTYATQTSSIVRQ